MASFVVPADYHTASQVRKAKSLFDTLNLRVELNKRAHEARLDANAKMALGLAPGSSITPTNADAVLDKFQKRDKILADLTAFVGNVRVAHEVFQRLESAGDLNKFILSFPKFKDEEKALPGATAVTVMVKWDQFKAKHGVDLSLIPPDVAPPVPDYVEYLKRAPTEEAKKYFFEELTTEDIRPGMDEKLRELLGEEKKREEPEDLKELEREAISYVGRPVGPLPYPYRAQPMRERTYVTYPSYLTPAERLSTLEERMKKATRRDTRFAQPVLRRALAESRREESEEEIPQLVSEEEAAEIPVFATRRPPRRSEIMIPDPRRQQQVLEQIAAAKLLQPSPLEASIEGKEALPAPEITLKDAVTTLRELNEAPGLGGIKGLSDNNLAMARTAAQIYALSNPEWARSVSKKEIRAKNAPELAEFVKRVSDSYPPELQVMKSSPVASPRLEQIINPELIQKQPTSIGKYSELVDRLLAGDVSAKFIEDVAKALGNYELTHAARDVANNREGVLAALEAAAAEAPRDIPTDRTINILVNKLQGDEKLSDLNIDVISKALGKTKRGVIESVTTKASGHTLPDPHGRDAIARDLQDLLSAPRGPAAKPPSPAGAEKKKELEMKAEDPGAAAMKLLSGMTRPRVYSPRRERALADIKPLLTYDNLRSLTPERFEALKEKFHEKFRVGESEPEDIKKKYEAVAELFDMIDPTDPISQWGNDLERLHIMSSRDLDLMFRLREWDPTFGGIRPGEMINIEYAPNTRAVFTVVDNEDTGNLDLVPFKKGLQTGLSSEDLKMIHILRSRYSKIGPPNIRWTGPQA
jgi:hypothetical protein